MNQNNRRSTQPEYTRMNWTGMNTTQIQNRLNKNQIRTERLQDLRSYHGNKGTQIGLILSSHYERRVP